MRKLDPDRMECIREYIEAYYNENNSSPTFRQITAGTGIPLSSVSRYLEAMKSRGEVSYGRSARIENEIMRQARQDYLIPIIGFVSCGPGEEEEEEILEYIRMPETLIGKGNFFCLTAKGESMVNASIYPGDKIIVRRQTFAEDGDIVVALFDGKNNLKQLSFQKDSGDCILISHNSDKEKYPDIHIPNTQLRIQGVAVGVFHSLTGKLGNVF